MRSNATSAGRAGRRLRGSRRGEGRSRLAAASLSAEDSVGFAQQPLDLVPDPRERLGSAFEGERLDLVSEKVQPFRDCRAPSLQLGANLLRSGDHAPLASTACGSASSSLSCRLLLRSRWTPRTTPTPATALNGLRLRGCGRHHGLLRVRHPLGNSLRWATGTTRAPRRTPTPATTTAPTVLRLRAGDASEQRLDRGADLLLRQVTNYRHQASLSRHRPPPCRRGIHEGVIGGKSCWRPTPTRGSSCGTCRKCRRVRMDKGPCPQRRLSDTLSPSRTVRPVVETLPPTRARGRASTLL